VANYFEIMPPEGLSAIKLDNSGRAKVQYTVKNVSGIKRDGRAVLVSVPNAPGAVEKGWVKVEPPTDKSFEQGQSQTYVVTIAVPPNSPPGSYGFRLDTVLVSRPDEGDRSSAMTFSVDSSSPSKKPFPWWIAAVALVALVVLGVVLYFVLRSKPAPPTPSPQTDSKQSGTGDSKGGASSQTARPSVIVGIGTDHQLYTRDTLTSSWALVPSSGAVLAVTRMKDGRILGVGMDHQLYTRDTLTSPWALVPGSGAVLGITQMQDGRIVGIGMDNLLYTRENLTSPWVQIPGSGAVIGITRMKDRRILGIGLDHQLYTREDLTSPWVLVPGSGSVIGITQMQDGKILGIGLDNLLYTRDSLTSPWVQIPGSGAVIGVTTKPL